MAYNQFDFDSFNKAVDAAGPGLKVVLAKALLQKANISFTIYENPVAAELQAIIGELTIIQAKNKAAAAARAAERSSTQTGEV